jgi:transposase-like protein
MSLYEQTSHQKLRRELGVPSSTLAAWVRDYSKALEKDSHSSSVSVHEEMMKLRKEVSHLHEEMMKLRKEVSHLREERDILKKALAIFSKAKI